MKRFRILTAAITTVCSIHASAATITVQDSAMFDISASYANGFDFAGEVTLAPNEYQVDLTSFLEGPELRVGSTGDMFAASALEAILLTRITDEDGNFVRFDKIDEYFSAIELGAPYEFWYSVSAVGFTTPGCSFPSDECGGGDTFERLVATSTITFFDSTAQEVPLGSTLPLLGLGLVGLALRQKGRTAL
ncbi:hypothetical protein [Allohahella sp. A8]|uniref:hypothetical protein n=1 Tax=Allohahella sp. A8 TaxID=3141461 RepID=UPI003A80CC66